MSGLWIDLLGRAWQLIAAGVLLAVIVAICLGPGDDYSCAPTDEDEDDTAAWDRGHDEWTDRDTGVSW